MKVLEKISQLAVIVCLAITVSVVTEKRVIKRVGDHLNATLFEYSEDLSNVRGTLAQFEEDMLATKELSDIQLAKVEVMPNPVDDDQKIATTSGAATASTATPASGPQIDLNSASLSELMTLSGIGQSYATRIIEGRPYASIDELTRVKGIGPKTLEKIRAQVTVK